MRIFTDIFYMQVSLLELFGRRYTTDILRVTVMFRDYKII